MPSRRSLLARHAALAAFAVLLASCGVGGSSSERSTGLVPPVTIAVGALPTVAAATHRSVIDETATDETATEQPAEEAAGAAEPGVDGACPVTEHGAVVDRDAQRGWLCEMGRPVLEFPFTSAWSMPDPGSYPVYSKTLNSSSTFGGHYSTMTHFVAFAYGKNTGAEVAFHSVPVLTDGRYVQPLESVGDPARRGESAGCIRVLPDVAVAIWDRLAVGDLVNVVT